MKQNSDKDESVNKLNLVNQTGRWKIIINIIVLAISLYGITRQKQTVKPESYFDNVMTATFGPIQKSILGVKTSIQTFFSDYITNISASKENRELQSKIGLLNEQIFSLKEIKRENTRLKSLLKFGEELHANRILARVVAWDASSDVKAIRIDKGKQDGVELFSTVVTSKGLVGYVYRLTDNFSDVLTILDPDNRVDSIVQRTRSHGISEGYGHGRCFLKYVLGKEQLVVDDLVMTSGLGNIYPKGIKVGKIIRIERESYGMTQHIEIAPSVDFSSVEEVAVLTFSEKSKSRKEWSELDQKAKYKE